MSPTVKNVIRPSASLSRRTTSSSADGPMRNSAASSGGSSASSISSAQSMPPGPFSSGMSGFVVSGSSSEGSSPRHSESGLPASRCASSRSVELDLLTLRPVARLRLLAHPLEPPLDVVAIGDDQLEPERLEVGCRIGVLREPVENGEERVRLPELARDLGASRERRRRGSPRASPSSSRRARRAGRAGRRRSPPSRRSASAYLRVRRDLRARVRQRVEERRLPRVGKADDPDLQRHDCVR